jgi:hypothetical protein
MHHRRHRGTHHFPHSNAAGPEEPIPSVIKPASTLPAHPDLAGPRVLIGGAEGMLGVPARFYGLCARQARFQCVLGFWGLFL